MCLPDHLLILAPDNVRVHSARYRCVGGLDCNRSRRANERPGLRQQGYPKVAAGHLPQNLAALSNAAISIVRVIGHFDYIPQANRHYAARPQDALDAILTPRQP